MAIHATKYDEPLPEVVEIEPDSEAKSLAHRLSALVGELETEAHRRVGLRQQVEERWIADLRQKHGRYDPLVEKDLKQKKKSRLFMNQTRSKTNALSARLSDILFPVDDRNWAIRPTPVPEVDGKFADLSGNLRDATDTMNDAKARAAEAEAVGDAARMQAAQGDRAEAEEISSNLQKKVEELAELREATALSARLMQDEIHDQLVSCQYQKSARQVIQDACDVGIGVMKGPITGYKPKAKWSKAETDLGYELTYHDDNRPAMYRCGYWGFFPDPDFTDVSEGNGVYERHLMNSKQMRRLARRSDIDQDSLRKVLAAGPGAAQNPTYLVDLNEITNQKNAQTSQLFQVWEYTGIIEFEQIQTLLDAFGDDGLDEVLDEDGSVDPLAELNVRIWFCNGELLSFGLNPLDSGECLYSVFTLEPDTNSPFGFGIPYLMRNPQSLLNAAYRMMSDNAGVGAAPQIVINDSVIEPADGDYTIYGGKIWKRQRGDLGEQERPFETYDIPMHQAELAGMINLAMEAIDDATYPSIAQGEQGATVTKTAQGMALLMNSANTIFRRWVKGYDDGVTKPDIRRMYDFNMQFSEKAEIKGDFEIDVRGSSVLLVREMQAQNILMIVDRYTDHPTYGPMLKERDAFEHLLRSNMLPVAEILRTPEDYEKEVDRRRNQPSPELQAAQIAAQAAQQEIKMRQEEMESSMKEKQLEWDTRLKIAQMTYDTQMNRIAEALNMKESDLVARIKTKEMEIDSRERGIAAEVAMAQKTGEHAGGAI